MQRVMTPRVNRRPITYTRQRHKTNRVPVWVCRVAAGNPPLGRHRIPWGLGAHAMGVAVAG
jgi:hypothetical protein